MSAPAEPPDEDYLPLCSHCGRPIPDGAARMRFYAIVYHFACWDTMISVPATPRAHPG